MIDRIYFYCPSYKIGGEQLLFIRCAHYLLDHSNLQVYYIDYPDGYAQEHLSDRVIRVSVHTVDLDTIPRGSLLVIALSYIDKFYDIFPVTPPDFRVLFWSLQPSNLTGKVLIRNRYNLMGPFMRRRFRELIQSLCSKGIISFMDYNNYYTVHKAFGVRIAEPVYLPVPINDRDIRVLSDIPFKIGSRDKLTILWMSRLDVYKKNTLMTIMNELEEAHKDFPLLLYIVGDGDSESEIKQYASYKSFPIRFLGRMQGDELNRFIDDNVDIGIGMGTSGLEIAKRGKPVIMKSFLSKVYDAGSVKDYIFLHQEYGYSLGSPDFPIDGQSVFMDKFREVLMNYSKVAQADYEYTLKKHSLSTTGDLLLKVTSLSPMSSADFDMVRHIGELVKRHRRNTLRKG